MFLCVACRGSQETQGHQDFQVRRDSRVKRSVQLE